MTVPRIHLAHDWLVGLRGGEWVLDALARMCGPTTVYTMMSDWRTLTPAIDACRVVTSPLQHVPGAAGRLRRWCLPLYPWAVERIRVAGPDDRDGCDLLISTSSAAIKGIRPPRSRDGAIVPHLCYCHSPARYAWDQAEDYAHGGLGGLRAAGLRMNRARFQAWDRRTCERVTRFIANSAHTARKIEQFYGRDATVVYPPVRTEFFAPDARVPREDFYLLVSALEPYKRVDLAIRACFSRGSRLVIAGSGSQRGALERLARETVSARRNAGSAEPAGEFLGRVDDETLRGLYRRARALIHPQTEDFGMIAVEAMACGCPVIALARGGALETVGDGCGVLFGEQTHESLADAMARCERTSFDAAACRENAERFGAQRFENAIRGHVRDMLVPST